MLVFYSLTLFVNAALLFIIEPMLAKMILPFLGGSPAVWNTSLVFYQACLLVGYAYAHFGSRWLGTRRHALLHLNLVLAALLLLPVALPTAWLDAPTSNPVGLVLSVLSLSIGFPFLVLSAGAPLLQKWFAWCDHSAARDPYFLYAASNGGSIAGLLAYPLLLEPRLTLSQQNQLWFFGYLGLLILTAICVLCFLRPLSRNREELTVSSEPKNFTGASALPVDFPRRMRWIFWSFVPSSLLLGVTSYITTDIASAPLFWVLPLTAYLLSFVLAFTRGSRAIGDFLARRQAFLLLAAAITVFLHATEPDWLILPLHLIAFFLTALVCHGRLAQDRPSATQVTDFYFWISLGGVLGGVFNALLAPLIFKAVLEYPLMMAAAAFIRPHVGEKSHSSWSRRLDWLLPPACLTLMVLITLALKRSEILPQANDRMLIFGTSGVIFLAFAYRPVRFGISIVALTLVSFWYPSPFGKVLYADRSFFGAYRATFDLENRRYLLFQGTTIHGAQGADDATRLRPLTYYYPTGPAGAVFTISAKIHADGNIAIVGLGTGALACYGAPTQKFTFYEIDPMVEKIARDEKLFTYLRDCPPKTEVVIGDARISLRKAPPRRYDLFVLDAFSSDVIPTHLLTREALELYLQNVAEDGLLLVHISNRFMDLAPVLDRLAHDLSLFAYIQNDFHVSAEESHAGKYSSRWVLMSRHQTTTAPYLVDLRWQKLNGALGGELWTDEFTDLLKVISWL
ncbi:MAG TPA: fused MFS/spermidine synthase [Terriglobales bacterium]|nr:fused MFS/spermidine synthase [Terriglobales bacterium]